MLELKILASLSSESSPASRWVSRLHHAFQTPTQLVLVMEYCYGDMRAHLKKQQHHRFPERLVRFYCYQLILGLGAIHSCGIIHRDIKVRLATGSRLILDSS